MSSLPTGTVTFLYTDIEGSTRRWDEHPGEMKAAVERHDALMREAVEGNGGVGFMFQGGAFPAALPPAPTAREPALPAPRVPPPQALEPPQVPLSWRRGHAHRR